jgi:hypothetical protein
MVEVVVEVVVVQVVEVEAGEVEVVAGLGEALVMEEEEAVMMLDNIRLDEAVAMMMDEALTQQEAAGSKCFYKILSQSRPCKMGLLTKGYMGGMLMKLFFWQIGLHKINRIGSHHLVSKNMAC